MKARRRATSLSIVLVLFVACGGATGSGSSSTDAQDASDALESVGKDVGPGGSLTVEEPLDGAVVAPDEAVGFRIHTTCGACTVRVASNLDDELFATVPAADGMIVRSVNGLSQGVHRISTSLVHPEGATLKTDERILRVDRAPTAPVVHIEPADPTTADALSVVLDTLAQDPDNDPLGYVYRWYRDDVKVSESGEKLLGAELTARGERWRVEAVASDDWAEGPPGIAEVIIRNSPPTLGSVVILPSVGTATTEFRCTFHDWQDPDPGDPQTPKFEFLKNTIAYEASEDSPIFPKGYHKGDEISCRVTPRDGDDDGEPVESAVVTIANSAPVVAAAVLTPASGDVTDTYSCTAEGVSDADEEVVSLKVRWRVEGELLPGETSETLPGSLFARGQTLRCEISGFDGATEGAPAISNELIIGDAPPTLVSALLGPTEAGESTVLTCESSEPQDPDGDPVSVLYEWSVDGEIVPGEEGSTLTGEHFDKGQLVGCRAIPVANGQEGEGVPAKPNVLISNTAPSLSGSALAPPEGGRLTNFTCVKGAHSDPDPIDDPLEWWLVADPDDSALPGYRIAWLIDEVLVPEAIDETYTPATANPGQVLRCRVTAFDGQVESAPAASGGVTLQNALPRIDSVSLEPASPSKADTLVCSAQGWTDPDDEGGSQIVAWIINSQILEGVSGSQLDAATLTKGDVIACRVTPNDGWDDGVALTSAPVTLGNAAPSVVAVQIDPIAGGPGTSFTCLPEGLTDLDEGDTVLPLYAWYINEALVPGAGQSSFMPVSAGSGDRLRCGVTPFDGQSEGVALLSNEALLQDLPPSISGAHIDPDQLTTTDSPRCVPEGFDDPEGAPPDYRYAWYRNSQVVDGATDALLPSSETTRGDEIFCIVMPFDGLSVGGAVVSNAITVANSAPGAFDVAISPEAPGASDATLDCVLETTPQDADGDTASYDWLWMDEGGTELGASKQIPSAGLSSCSVLLCSATAKDGYGGSSEAVSSPVVFDGSFGARFDGLDARVVVEDDLALNLDVFTIELWLLPDSLEQGTVPIARGPIGGIGWALSMETGGALSAELTSNQGSLSLSSGTPLSTSAWVHVALQVDGSYTRLYVQGALQAGAPLAGSFATAGPLVIGARHTGGLAAQAYAGIIDEVRLSNIARYDIAFTPEIRLSSDANTVALFHLDQVSLNAPTITDSGPKGLDGSSTGLTDAAGVCFEGGEVDLPPTAPQVAVTPEAPTIDDALLCQVLSPGVDPEGAPITHTPYWYLGAARITDLDGLWTLDPVWTDYCDELTCRVIPNDGALQGPWGEATVQVEAPNATSVWKYHSLDSATEEPVETDFVLGGSTIWQNSHQFGQVFRLDKDYVHVLGVRVYLCTACGGSVVMRYVGPESPGQLPSFGTAYIDIPNGQLGSFGNFQTVSKGWNTFWYDTPLYLDEDVSVSWVLSSTGVGGASNRKVWYDADGTNSATRNFVYKGGIHYDAEPLGVTGDFPIELILADENNGECP